MLKSKAIILSLILLAVVLVSCSDNSGTEEELLNKAKSLYDSAVATTNNDLFTESINAYKEFLEKYPDSEKAIFAYNQIAGINFENLKNFQESIKTYEQIAEKYPESKEAKQSLFMVAFIYDETLKDKDNAIISYKKFLEKYPEDTDPDDKMSESAKIMLQVLESGTSVEEMILKNIEEQEKKGDQEKEDTEVKEEPKKENDKEIKIKEVVPPKEEADKETNDDNK
jgi:outer membrane protein assembly factor BamD (BamD/ComL family)